MQDVIDVAPLMDEIAHELEPLAEKKGMSFRTEGGGTVLGSDRLIARALYKSGGKCGQIRRGRRTCCTGCQPPGPKCADPGGGRRARNPRRTQGEDL